MITLFTVEFTIPNQTSVTVNTSSNECDGNNTPSMVTINTSILWELSQAIIALSYHLKCKELKHIPWPRERLDCILCMVFAPKRTWTIIASSKYPRSHDIIDLMGTISTFWWMHCLFKLIRWAAEMRTLIYIHLNINWWFYDDSKVDHQSNLYLHF